MVLSDTTNHDGGAVYPPSFRMIAGTLTLKDFLTCPHLLSLSFIVLAPQYPSSPLTIHHPLWNRIPLGMMAQPLTIRVFLPCQCSHLPIFHIITPHLSSPLYVHRQFWSLSIHQHQVPPRMNPIILPRRFSLLLCIHIIQRRFSLLHIVQSNLPLTSSPPFLPQKTRQFTYRRQLATYRRQLAILHRPKLPPLLITLITTTGITSQKYDLSVHHQV